MKSLKHKRGGTLGRPLKPLGFYEQKYGASMPGLNIRLRGMLQRGVCGHEGAGLACVKTEAAPGGDFPLCAGGFGEPVAQSFSSVSNLIEFSIYRQLHDAGATARRVPFAGCLYSGHLRRFVAGKRGLSCVSAPTCGRG